MNYYQLPPEQPTSSYRALESGDYELVVRQQPKEALVTVEGKEKNRKPVDPPPIIELKVAPSADPTRQFLQSPYLFMQCTLQVDSQNDDSHVKSGQAITGQSVSSLHRLKDINNEDGGFFVFGDISIRSPGKHRLNFSLFELKKETGEVQFHKTITSDYFDVVQHKQWHGLEESTHLSRTFSDQGVRLRLRKENRNLAGQKRTYQQFSPRGSAHAGPSSAAVEQTNPGMYGAPYVYGESAAKRPRSDEFGQTVSGFDTRAGAPNMQPAYPIQPTGPIHSPQAAYGMQTPTAANPSWTYTQGSASAPARYPESSARAAQGMTPSAPFGLQPIALGAEAGHSFTRRATDPFTQVAQTSPPTPYQGAGDAMYSLPTSASMAGPTTFSEHEPAAMARQQTHTHPVASPTSSTRSNMNPVAPPFAMQTPQLQPQNYASLSDSSHYAYQATPPYRQAPAYPHPHTPLVLQQPLPIRQQPGEPYVQQQQQQSFSELGQGYQTPGGGAYPTTQGQDQPRY